MIINKIQESCIRLFQTNRWQSVRDFSGKPCILKTVNSEYPNIKVWFTDQNSQRLEIEERINLTLVIK